MWKLCHPRILHSSQWCLTPDVHHDNSVGLGSGTYIFKSFLGDSDTQFWLRVTVLKLLVAQSCPILCNPWTVACQAPLSMEFSRQEYWNGQPFTSPGYLPNPGIKARSPALQADSLPAEPQGKPISCRRRNQSKCQQLLSRKRSE